MDAVNSHERELVSGFGDPDRKSSTVITRRFGSVRVADAVIGISIRHLAV